MSTVSIILTTFWVTSYKSERDLDYGSWWYLPAVWERTFYVGMLTIGTPLLTLDVHAQQGFRYMYVLQHMPYTCNIQHAISTSAHQSDRKSWTPLSLVYRPVYWSKLWHFWQPHQPSISFSKWEFCKVLFVRIFSTPVVYQMVVPSLWYWQRCSFHCIDLNVWSS